MYLSHCTASQPVIKSIGRRKWGILDSVQFTRFAETVVIRATELVLKIF